MAFLRRLILLVAVLGAGAAGYTWWQRRDAVGDQGPPEWPPLPEPSPAPAASTPQPSEPGPVASAPSEVEPTTNAASTEPEPAPSTEPAWVEPVDGACPVTHPIKLNESSGIFHQPGGRFYDRTNPDRCYASAEAATADGYRAAKA